MMSMNMMGSTDAEPDAFMGFSKHLKRSLAHGVIDCRDCSQQLMPQTGSVCAG